MKIIKVHIDRFLTCAFALVILFSIYNCEEKLPVQIPPQEVAEAFLEMTSDYEINDFPYGSEASNGILFKLGIRNIFDETFSDKPYIDATVKIWLEPHEPVKTLNVHKEDMVNLVIDPYTTAWITLYWDQTDENGEPLWTRAINLGDQGYTPLNFKAAAEIKFYKNIPSHHTDTLRFTVQYSLKQNESTVNFHAVERICCREQRYNCKNQSNRPERVF